MCPRPGPASACPCPGSAERALARIITRIVRKATEPGERQAFGARWRPPWRARLGARSGAALRPGGRHAGAPRCTGARTPSGYPTKPCHMFEPASSGAGKRMQGEDRSRRVAAARSHGWRALPPRQGSAAGLCWSVVRLPDPLRLSRTLDAARAWRGADAAAPGEGRRLVALLVLAAEQRAEGGGLDVHRNANLPAGGAWSGCALGPTRGPCGGASPPRRTGVRQDQGGRRTGRAGEASADRRVRPVTATCRIAHARCRSAPRTPTAVDCTSARGDAQARGNARGRRGASRAASGA
jgi:hypothetical protein